MTTTKPSRFFRLYGRVVEKKGENDYVVHLASKHEKPFTMIRELDNDGRVITEEEAKAFLLTYQKRTNATHVWKVLKPPPFRRDCGTGSGGFQLENSCAGGDGGGTDEHSGSTESTRIKLSAEFASVTLSESLARIEKLAIRQEVKDRMKDLYEGPSGIQSFVENIEETMLAETARIPIDIGEHISGLVRASIQHIGAQIDYALHFVPPGSEEHNQLYKEIAGSLQIIAKDHNALLHFDDPEALSGKDKTDMLKKISQAALGSVVANAMFAENSESGSAFIPVPVFLNTSVQGDLPKGTMGYFAPPGMGKDKAYMSGLETLSNLERGHIVIKTKVSPSIVFVDELPGKSGAEGSIAKRAVHEFMHARQLQTPDTEDRFTQQGGKPVRYYSTIGAGWNEKLTLGQKKMAQAEGMTDVATGKSHEYLAGISEYLLSAKYITPTMWKLYDKYGGPPISPRLRKARGGKKNPYRRGTFPKLKP